MDLTVGGVTLRVSVPASTSDHVGPIGDRARLFTSLKIRDDSITLFGFLTEEARSTFETLIAISGVGPRLALSVLSRFTPESLASAVNAGDADAFTGVPGVGKKTAGRIILELRGKLGEDWIVDAGGVEDRDLIDALTSLGYTSSEARRAAESMPSEHSMSLEEKVRVTLQRMSGS